MQFEPNGTVTLLSGVPFTPDYQHTRNFNSLSEQQQYFRSKNAITFTNCSVTRRDIMYVAVDENIEHLWQYNYLMYQNETMGNKWFYAFIEKLEIRAASTTFVYFRIDVLQTWMFEVKVKQSFIERRHPGIESIGTKYYAPENLYYGENYETVAQTTADEVRDTTDSSCVLLISNVDLSADFGTLLEPKLVGADGGVYHRLPTACNYYVVAPDKYGDASITDVFNLLKNYPWVSKGIIGMTILPNYVLDGIRVNEVAIGGSGFIVGQISSDSAPAQANVWSGNIFNAFNSVKNKKLLMYPYAFVEISAQNGTTLIIKPQYTGGGSINIMRKGMVTFNPEIKYYLTGYEGLGEGYDYSITIKDLPQLPVQDDSYLLSINQQKFMIQTDRVKNTVSSVGGIIGGLLSGNLAGAANSLTNAMIGTEQSLFKEDQVEAQSPTLNGQIGGSGFNYATGQMGIKIRWRQIPQGYRQIIDNFFTMYGYKFNALETPDPTRMSRFDYIKTKGCIAEGGAPQDDVREIMKCYDNGITFWHDDDIGNYDNNTGVKV